MINKRKCQPTLSFLGPGHVYFMSQWLLNRLLTKAQDSVVFSFPILLSTWLAFRLSKNRHLLRASYQNISLYKVSLALFTEEHFSKHSHACPRVTGLLRTGSCEEFALKPMSVHPKDQGFAIWKYVVNYGGLYFCIFVTIFKNSRQWIPVWRSSSCLGGCGRSLYSVAFSVASLQHWYCSNAYMQHKLDLVCFFFLSSLFGVEEGWEERVTVVHYVEFPNNIRDVMLGEKIKSKRKGKESMQKWIIWLETHP